ncbi:hypothetical protein J6590_083883, partial [Homalodisca vitripennis]
VLIERYGYMTSDNMTADSCRQETIHRQILPRLLLTQCQVLIERYGYMTSDNMTADSCRQETIHRQILPRLLLTNRYIFYNPSFISGTLILFERFLVI